MVQITATYEGDLRCSATHGPSGNTLITDAPVDNHGKGEAFSPTDLVATALGTCMLTIIGIIADRKNLDIKGAGVVVKKEMSTDTPRRISALHVDITLPLPENHPDRKVLESGALSCPVYESLDPKMEKQVHFHWKN